MKILILILAVGLFSCHNESAQKKLYDDSVSYYTQKLTALTDSGYSHNDSIKSEQKARILIYQTMRQHYIDKTAELK